MFAILQDKTHTIITSLDKSIQNLPPHSPVSLILLHPNKKFPISFPFSFFPSIFICINRYIYIAKYIIIVSKYPLLLHLGITICTHQSIHPSHFTFFIPSTTLTYNVYVQRVTPDYMFMGHITLDLDFLSQFYTFISIDQCNNFIPFTVCNKEKEIN